MTRPLRTVVLAAGLGTRMKSDLPKVLHPVLGRPMVCWAVDTALTVGAERVTVVVGHGREQVEATLASQFPQHPVDTCVQHQMLGTADAVASARETFADFDGIVWIAYGDVPNVDAATVQTLLDAHRTGRSPLTILTAMDPEEHQYGRIERDAAGNPLRIVEYKDADATIRAIREVNVGVWMVDAPFLAAGLAQTTSENAAREFYLTDLVEIAARQGTPAQAVVAPDIAPLHGVNNRAQLAAAEDLAQDRLLTHWMLQGVTIQRPATVRIEAEVTLGRDVTIEPGVCLLGRTHVGDGAHLGAGVRLKDTTVPPGTFVGNAPHRVYED